MRNLFFAWIVLISSVKPQAFGMLVVCVFSRIKLKKFSPSSLSNVYL
jgi:hypothetical protein